MRDDPARRYRLQSAEFASPVGLVVHAYEQIIGALRHAAQSIDAGRIEAKTHEVNRAIAIVGHLQAMLDSGASPEVAAKLEAFYATMRYQIVKASAETSGNGLTSIAGYFATMRDAWRVVEKEHPTLPAASARSPLRASRPVESISFPADQAPPDWSA